MLAVGTPAKGSGYSVQRARRCTCAAKTNVGPDGGEILLRYTDGCFVLDDEPI